MSVIHELFETTNYNTDAQGEMLFSLEISASLCGFQDYIRMKKNKKQNKQKNPRLTFYGHLICSGTRERTVQSRRYSGFMISPMSPAVTVAQSLFPKTEAFFCPCVKFVNQCFGFYDIKQTQ